MRAWSGMSRPSAIRSNTSSASTLATPVRHTASGGEEGWFDITICAIGDGVRVSVGDSGASSVPQIPRDGGEPDVMTGGRGLRIADQLADRWGHSGEELGRVVWFEVSYAK